MSEIHHDHPQGHHPSSAPPDVPPPSPRQLRRVGIIVAIVAVAIAIAGIGIRWAHEREVRRWTDTGATPIVSVMTPGRGVSGQQTTLPGNIQAWYDAPLYARVSGYLKKWYQDYGAHVKKGQLLAEIDAPDLDAELAAAQATLKAAEAQVKVREAEMEFARTTYDRWRDSPKGVVSEQERESKKADFASASARYNSAIADVRSDQGAVDRLSALEQFKRIIAPFDGVVTARNTDIGDLINAGSGNSPQLFRVADVHEMRVFVQVPQKLSAEIHSGLIAELDLPQYPDRTFKATVATTSEAINEAARTLLVELHADNTGNLLQPGTYAEVHFDLASNPDTVRIPTSALVFRQQGMQVAILDKNNRVELRPVKLGRNLGTDVEVLSGVTPDDRIVESPPDSLSNGDLVRVLDIPQAPDDNRLASKGPPVKTPPGKGRPRPLEAPQEAPPGPTPGSSAGTPRGALHGAPQDTP